MPFPPTSPPLARALAARDYLEPTPVQSAVLEADASARDLLVTAQTGSGKTVAYGLALANTLLGDAERLPQAEAPMALVIAPTRELALQVERELAWLYGQAGARVVACVGGMDPRAERRRLADGCHIVVGTPGRLRDHLERNGLDLSQLQAAVLDEADEMLDMGFREDLEFILDKAPPERRTLLFSATLPKAIAALAQRYQRDAMRIEVAGQEGGHADIEYRAIRVHPNEIEHAVVNLLRLVEAPSSIIFCNTRNSVRHLQAILLERGFSAVILSGELGQSERNQALQALRDGRARVCVATDVAARGLDLPSLGLVIHAEMPHDAEVMQHRSGRTGRAGRKGISALLVPRSRRRRAEQMMAIAGVEPVWSGPPTAEEIRGLDHERLLRDPLLNGEASEEDLEMARALLAERSAEDIAAALARIYRSRLPSPEDVTDPGVGPAPRVRAERGAGGERGRDPFFDAPRTFAGTGVWYQLNIGRRDRADPRWLLPLICRRGDITKKDVGAIRIFERDTRFEVTEAAAERFAAAIRQPGGRDDNARITLAPDGPGAEDTAPPAKSSGKPGRSGPGKAGFGKGGFSKGAFAKGGFDKGGFEKGGFDKRAGASDEAPRKHARPRGESSYKGPPTDAYTPDNSKPAHAKSAHKSAHTGPKPAGKGGFGKGAADKRGGDKPLRAKKPKA